MCFDHQTPASPNTTGQAEEPCRAGGMKHQCCDAGSAAVRVLAAEDDVALINLAAQYRRAGHPCALVVCHDQGERHPRAT